MPSVITTIRPTTEVEAVNVMLGAIGEAPLASGADLAALSLTDGNIESAVGILKESVRDVLTAGWRFNTLTGYEIAPTATYSWLDTAGVTTLLNVFKVPAWVLAWKVTPCSQMFGLDIVEGPSLKYTEASASVMVLFDRVRNRDGFANPTYPYLYLDVVRSLDFVQMPESARKAATIIAARRLCQRVPASAEQASFTQQDEAAALRALKREQGIPKQLNLFETSDAQDILGRRPMTGGGFNTTVYRGGA